ncbi:MAG: MgtC/SapB family protein [Gammaproteobacteria bacterium]
MDTLLHLGLALAVGLLIGIERGWQMRAAAEGSRLAGVRTFGLIALLGGLWALLAQQLGEVLLGFAFAAVAALIIIAHATDKRVDRDHGITTVVAALIAFALGALSLRGYATVAASGAVVTAVLLSLKPTLHQWLQHLEAKELHGALKLLLISVVMLPVLPNRGYGPWNALNPYEIWWMVVLIAGISFAGYFAMKMAGTRRGTLLTGVFGGLASSTALTLSFSRLARRRKSLGALLAVGVLVASATMFPRIVLEVSVINAALVARLLPALAAMMLVMLVAAAWLWRGKPAEGDTGELPLRNPFELLPALQFGVLLALVMLLAEALRSWFGHAGIYLLAAGSGVSDVDAITLSMARLARDGLDPAVAGRAIVLAASVNTLVKGGLVLFIGGKRIGIRILAVMAVSVAAGAAVVFVA